MFSFAKQKKAVELFPYIRKICDLTTPNLTTGSEDRSENRFNRTIPTLLCPWDGERPSVDECTICLTCDLADRGVRLVLSQPLRAEQVLLGYWIDSVEMSEPWFFVGDVLRVQKMGRRFWSIGIELKEFANANHRDEISLLKTEAAGLLGPADASVIAEV